MISREYFKENVLKAFELGHFMNKALKKEQGETCETEFRLFTCEGKLQVRYGTKDKVLDIINLEVMRGLKVTVPEGISIEGIAEDLTTAMIDRGGLEAYGVTEESEFCWLGD